MRRRRLLRYGGSVLTGTALTGMLGTAAADPSDANLIEAGARTDPPAAAVDTTQVAPFPFLGDQRVASGDWIDHAFGLIAQDRETLDELARSVVVRIDGERIDDPEQYFGEVTEIGDSVAVFWALFAEPKPPGTYSFRVDLDDVSVTGTYTVA